MAASRRTALYLFCATVFLVPCILWNGTHNAGLIKYLIARISVLVVSGLLLYNAFRTGNVTFPNKKALLFGIAFILYAAIRCRGSQYSDWNFFGDFALSILLFFEIGIVLDNRRNLTILLIVWQVASQIVMFYYLLQLAGRDFLAWSTPDLVGSTYLNRNALCYYLLCTYPFSLFLMVHSRGWKRILPAVTLVLFAIIALFSPSRGTKAVLLLSLPPVLWYLQKRFHSVKWKKTMQAGAIAVVLLLLSSAAYLLHRSVTQGYDQVNRYSHNRLLIVKETIPVIRKNIRFGYGAGTFSKVFSRYRSPYIGYAFPFRDPLYNSHNEILELTFEYGIIGVLPLALFLLSCTGRKLNFRKDDRYHNDLLFSSFLACIGCFIFAQVVSVSHFFHCTYFSWIALAIFTRQNREPQTVSIRDGWPRNLFLAGLVLWGTCSLWIIRRHINDFRSEYYVHQTIRIKNPANAVDRISALLAKALRYNPHNMYALFQRANLSTLKGDYASALEDYRLIEQYDPYMLHLHFNKGVIYFRQHDYKNAIAMFLVTTRLYPRFSEAVYYLAKAHYAEKQFKESLFWCRHLLLFEPENRQFVDLYNEVVARKNETAKGH